MAETSALRPIPTDHPPDHVASALASFDDWFYDFTFSNGVSTAAPDQVTSEIHATRAELIFPLLDEAYGSRWPDLSCLDLACHQGWFAFQLAARGAREVVGIDVRPRHVEVASEVLALGTFTNIRFRCANLFELAGSGVGPCDLTLFLGILYHLDNPFEALRLLRSLTRRVAVLETQVARRPLRHAERGRVRSPLPGDPPSGHERAVCRVRARGRHRSDILKRHLLTARTELGVAWCSTHLTIHQAGPTLPSE